MADLVRIPNSKGLYALGAFPFWVCRLDKALCSRTWWLVSALGSLIWGQ